jgi:hypothetical protein
MLWGAQSLILRPKIAVRRAYTGSLAPSTQRDFPNAPPRCQGSVHGFLARLCGDQLFVSGAVF